ncbi:TRAPP subunit trs31 [Tulasnella sp. 424]|nr:TRAPP subunit trs31 [Tulasnella sp. 424]
MKAPKRETRFLPALMWIHTVLWRQLFGKSADAIEKSVDCNILHRDISERNILLPADEDAASGNRAFLTDFGLAMKIESKAKLPLPSSVKHDHMAKADELYMPLSMVQHGVKSLFWVGIYVLFKFASCEAFESMSAKEKKVVERAGGRLNRLRSSDMKTVEIKKIIWFEEDLDSGEGGLQSRTSCPRLRLSVKANPGPRERRSPSPTIPTL